MQFSIEDVTDGYVRVVFANGDRNMLDAATIEDLAELVDLLVRRGDVHVVVLSSANPDYFMARYAVSGAPPDGADPFAGLRRFVDVTARLQATPIVWIAEIRGRARGGGDEIALACDLRYASIERALLGQPEVPSGLLPAGGGIERLTALVGRSRALEIVLTGDDFDARTAELYGWITRAIPDDDLLREVDRIARRLAILEPSAIASCKRLIGRGRTDGPSAIAATIAALPALASTTGARRRDLATRAAAEGPTFELNLGDRIGTK